MASLYYNISEYGGQYTLKSLLIIKGQKHNRGAPKMNLFTFLVELWLYDLWNLCSKKDSFFEHLFGPPISHGRFSVFFILWIMLNLQTQLHEWFNPILSGEHQTISRQRRWSSLTRFNCKTLPKIHSHTFLELCLQCDKEIHKCIAFF